MQNEVIIATNETNPAAPPVIRVIIHGSGAESMEAVARKAIAAYNAALQALQQSQGKRG